MEDIAPVIKQLIAKIDENPTREGLQDTPSRVEKFYHAFFSKKAFNVTTFENENYNQMIVQTNIPFYSLCEHHMVPFFGVAHVAYIPKKRIVGLSKFSRIIDHFAHQLQNQERITTQIADFFDSKLNPHGIAVTLTARHLCMEMRGIERIGATTTTTSLKGTFRSDASTRNEFMHTIQTQVRKD